MPAIPAPPLAPVQLPPLPIHRFTVDQFHRMVSLGIVGSADPVELVDGLIVAKNDSSLAPAIRISDSYANGNLPSPLRVKRFSVAEYDQMIGTGILGEEDTVELVEGWIVEKMPRNPPHDAVISILHNRVLNPRLPAGWFCRGQSAIVTDEGKPEPDIAIVRGSELDYLNHHPRPGDLAAVIEVSDTTLDTDRAIKGPGYARAAIPVYWIVNLVDLQIEVYSQPTGAAPIPSYLLRLDYRAGEEVPLVISGQTIAMVAVQELLPRTS